ncbi:MAG: peptide chain release factor N(5)-glutamine methyltransferase [Bacteroidetes bacterium]|nr:peptide chain release factor N(5)-glutamine methyltransferase [Bacteroidota bacterium]
MNEYLGFTRRHLQLKANQSLGAKETERFKTILSQLKNHKPIQYILGHTEFYGLKIRVNKHVLIPRPETEELVEEIIENTDDKKLELNILDIGTGSGCIAIALKKNLPESTVSAIDISDEALLVAKENSILNHTLINFLQADILGVNNTSTHQLNNFDIIVSNPPYIRISEKEKMSNNVLGYEPHLALFVNDNDPLIFYTAIVDFALQNLSPDGKLYFEINEALGGEVKKLLEGKGFKNVKVKKDMSGKDRLAIGSK